MSRAPCCCQQCRVDAAFAPCSPLSLREIVHATGLVRRIPVNIACRCCAAWKVATPGAKRCLLDRRLTCLTQRTHARPECGAHGAALSHCSLLLHERLQCCTQACCFGTGGLSSPLFLLLHGLAEHGLQVHKLMQPASYKHGATLCRAGGSAKRAEHTARLLRALPWRHPAACLCGA